METFTIDEIRDLLNQVYNEEISFSQMVGIMNNIVSEANEPQYKDGDFVINEAGCILIFREKVEDSIYDHAYLTRSSTLFINPFKKSHYEILGFATVEEKQRVLDALTKKGKRWSEEKLCIEDIPIELKKGDLAIFWDKVKRHAIITFYERLDEDETCLLHKDIAGSGWENAIKFESKEQFERLIKGEI